MTDACQATSAAAILADLHAPYDESSMTLGNIDLDALARRLATREPRRTEANVQSDLHALLLAAPLKLEEDDLRDDEVILEQQAGAGHRIDVEAGFCVFEVKRDLRKGNVRKEAVKQLAGYIDARTKTMQQRYVGVLTDGAEWQLFHLVEGEPREVNSFLLDAAKPDVDGLCIWLEGVLATAEKIEPAPREIGRRLGAESPGHALDYAELAALYEKNKNIPSVRLKRELWARLLTTAFGTGFTNSDALFIDHTLLVVTAEVIAHAVVGLDPTAADISAASLLSGQLFAKDAQVHGVVESDFFDWVGEVPGGGTFVKGLARRLARFAWQDVEHDVLKVLYENVIAAAQRKQLGEYYTPDWLADRVVNATVTDPLNQRVLDPACGSGTFLFHAIRRYLDASDAAGVSSADALLGLTKKVVGMDIHPVAVTFARVTYLLAIGTARLSASDRPPLSIPVYLGDSIQWGQERTLFTANALVIPATDGGQLFATELKFPSSAITDAGQFDLMVSELADLAARTRPAGAPVPSLTTSIFRRYSIPDADQPTITETFKTLCRLHDEGRDHIWGYYVRNLARPFWLARPANRVDVLVGNPPWLAYRHMTAEMQKEFRLLSEERGLWAGAAVATHQDLSGLFVLRAVERYLHDGGRFGFVMPLAALSRRQFAGFRAGRYELKNQHLILRFDEPWDVHAVKPAFFPVPASVVMGARTDSGTAVPLPSHSQTWKGKLPQVNVSWQRAAAFITTGGDDVRRASELAAGGRSPYHSRFSQGAIVVPRFLLIVEERPAGPLGAGAGRVAVRSRRTANEKAPWKSMPALEGSVDRQFVRPLHLGDTLLPYRMLQPLQAVVPWDGKRLLRSPEERALYPGLADWWARAEEVWNRGKSGASSLTLLDQLDYRGKLSKQLPIVPGAFRVVYNKSGMYLAAAVVNDTSVIDHKLYWGTAVAHEEARYLEAILNSSVLTERIRPLQGRGEHNPRDYDMYVWQMPIPAFDSTNERHQRLAALAVAAEQIAAGVTLPAGKRFESLRRMVRQAVADSETGRAIEQEVALVLEAEDPVTRTATSG
jgi:SAM-dependent methyltransferase